MKIPHTLLQAMTLALNKYLHMDVNIQKRLKPLNGKVVEIELKGLDATFFILIEENGMRLVNEYDGKSDTILRGTPLGLLSLHKRPSTETSQTFFSHDLEISGNIHLGEALKDLFDKIDIDWEEQLADKLGDVAAHFIATNAQSIKAWLGQTKENMQDNISEYVQEEARFAPPKVVVEDFYAQVNQLRMDVDRLEARIKRLK